MTNAGGSSCRSSPPEPHLLFQLLRLGRAHDLEPALLDLESGKFERNSKREKTKIETGRGSTMPVFAKIRGTFTVLELSPSCTYHYVLVLVF